jgi:hypothetical protein
MNGFNPVDRRRTTAGVLLLFAAFVMVLSRAETGAGGQLTYSKGQDVSPAFEGWEQAADGSRSFIFGYMNRNWEEEFDIPVGPDNNIQPGGPDSGQPTHFFPRRNLFVFRVPVPKNFTDKDEMIWTLITHGKTDRAYASLRADYFVDNVVQASELGAFAGAALSPDIHTNEAPTVRIDRPQSRSVKVGQPLTLVASASDDGKPKGASRGGATASRRPGGADSGYAAPRQGILTDATGLRLSWFVYRGAGKVTFNPEQFKVWQDTRADANSPWSPYWVTPPVPPNGKWSVEVFFNEPGTYVIRCQASDGALIAYEDVNVTVTP